MERTNDPTGGGGDEPAGMTEVHVTQTQTIATDGDAIVIREEIRETLAEARDPLDPTAPKHEAARESRQDAREDAIERVEHVARRAADRVSEAGQGIMSTIRDNPVPAALVGVGVAWLLWNRRSGASRSTSRPGAHSRGNPYTGVSYSGYAGGSAWQDGMNRRGAPFGDVDAERGALDAMRARAGDLGDRVQEVAGTVAGETRRQARRAEELFREHPLAVTAATLALGAMAALAVPETPDGAQRTAWRVKNERPTNAPSRNASFENP